MIRSALDDAERNADYNNVSNINFLKANLDTFFKSGQLPKNTPKPNVVIVDPPRAGMHPDMAQYLPKLKAEKIIYFLVIRQPKPEMQKYYIKMVMKLEKLSWLICFLTPHILKQ